MLYVLIILFIAVAIIVAVRVCDRQPNKNNDYQADPIEICSQLHKGQEIGKVGEENGKEPYDDDWFLTNAGQPDVPWNNAWKKGSAFAGSRLDSRSYGRTGGK